jgi:hypothetical protein
MFNDAIFSEREAKTTTFESALLLITCELASTNVVVSVYRRLGITFRKVLRLKLENELDSQLGEICLSRICKKPGRVLNKCQLCARDALSTHQALAGNTLAM